jgi:hypothetical protein
MSVLLVVLVLTAPPAQPAGAAAAATPQPSAEKVLTGRELRQAIFEALRRWARPAQQDLQPAGRELLALYRQLQRDTQMSRAMREELRLKLRYRLADISGQLSARLPRDQRQAARAQPASVAVPAEAALPLAQIGAGAQGPGAGGAPGAGQPPPDNGQELVDLIQTVISPSSWDTLGGPGTIYYWRPGMAIVVRQTDEIHAELGGMIEQLENAGR